MNYVFFGSPRFAEIVLKKLIDAGIPPSAVISNPDRPFGRKKILTPPPTKVLARANGIAVLQPEALNEDFFASLRALHPDFAVLAAYANILPKSIIALPRLGIIGVHPSLLPRHRGATPIQSVLLSGETQTGVSLFLLDQKVDHGCIIADATLELTPRETFLTLTERLATLAGELLVTTLPKFAHGIISTHPQDETRATYTKKFTTEAGFVDLSTDDPVQIERKIRALNPDPGVYTFAEKNGKKVRVKLLEAELRDGALVLTRIQYEGAKPMRPDSASPYTRTPCTF